MAQRSQREQIFANEVNAKFELYNSLFLTLPFYKIKDTGTLLPLFFRSCEEGVRKKKTPAQVIQYFFGKYTQYDDPQDEMDLLFRFIQYIERQVVLFDAVEDAAFSKLNQADHRAPLRALLQRSSTNKDIRKQLEKLIEEFSLRLVLTAHPTQFYPGNVLAIINDLTQAIKVNDISMINVLLQQLGKTPFFNKKSPTPVDEALSLSWYLENVFYFAAANIQKELDEAFAEYRIEPKKILEMGFWPGGDRDGNPNVHPETTLEVARMLRQILFRCYYRDFRILKRRITFRGVEAAMASTQDLLYNHAFDKSIEGEDISGTLTQKLEGIKETLVNEHDGLFSDLVDDLLRKIELFGSYFASLDIRQDSRVLRKVHEYCRKSKILGDLYPENYDELDEQEKLKLISLREVDLHCRHGEDELIDDTIRTIREVKTIQQQNGQAACDRFIISNCQQASDILQLMELFLWNGWKKEHLYIDFVPLFETVDDLELADEVMEKLYSNPLYKKHLESRGNRQDIMLGFSDSTKDGGYLMANWSIFNAKTRLSAIAEKHGIQLAFFDGRGGPPARGGGKTHRFYASMGKEIANKNIQLTIQGQTISSQYGSVDSAAFNIEQLINAGISSGMRQQHNVLLDKEYQDLLNRMAKDSHTAFVGLREHPLFLDYLEKRSPLKLLSRVNISSRPVKRNKGKLKLEDLRAISFVTAWSQLKQNIPGFYGMGTALKKQEEAGNWELVQRIYQDSDYFRTIIDNCMMSMTKSDFNITSYLAGDEEFGDFWQGLHAEFELAKDMLLKLSGQEELMDNYPTDRRSIATRERIVLPLVLVQHWAIDKLNHDLPEGEQKVLEKLVVRTMFGIVNAGRNLV